MEQAPVRAPVIPGLHFKVGLVLIVTLLIAIVAAAYLLYAKGYFEKVNHYTLVADSGDGITPGMAVTYSGMPIGQVKDFQLAGNGQVLVEVSVPLTTAIWIRESSKFSLDKPLVGNAKIRVVTVDMQSPLLEDGALRNLEPSEDMTKKLQVLVPKVQSILDNVNHLTRQDGEINQALADVQTVTGRMAGEGGVLAGVFGSRKKADKVVAAVDQTNKLLANLEGVSLRVDTLLAKTDKQVFEPGGVMDNTNETIKKVQTILEDVRLSLAKVDAVLADVKGITANTKAATDDLDLLKAEVEEALRRTNRLLADIQSKWPFSRKSEIKLP
jgi:phospholipid/cholesterol/gamma-HCH transport system substrate-binding protein